MSRWEMLKQKGIIEFICIMVLLSTVVIVIAKVILVTDTKDFNFIAEKQLEYRDDKIRALESELANIGHDLTMLEEHLKAIDERLNRIEYETANRY